MLSFAIAFALRNAPAIKQRYEALALEFVQNAGSERDLDITALPLANIKPKPDSGSGNTNPHM